MANCHSESIIIETERKLSVEEVRRLLSATPGITIEDDLFNSKFPTPRNSNGRDDVRVGRIREDSSAPKSIALWCVSDNLRKGAATNAVQIAELLTTHRG